MRDKAIPADIQPGLVLHLNPTRLLATGAKVTGPAGSWVQGDHFFLCVGIEGKKTKWVPLFSNDGKDRVQIESADRTGHQKWTAGTFHYHPAQVWTAGVDAIVRAAEDGGDQSTSGARNLLAAQHVPKV